MPKGPQGQKRPADAIGLAVMVGKIATGEIEDTPEAAEVSEVASRAGAKGGGARATKLTEQRRREIAASAARARWSKAKG